MKKSIIICVTCIVVTGLYVDAQNKTTIVRTESYVVTPPPPPIPPDAPASPSTDEIDQLVPPPPVPPIPPLPPVPPVADVAHDCPGSVVVEIINSNGYEISIHKIKGVEMVILQKDGKTQKIKLATWNASRKFYEKKYGQLPPPPPPVPAVEEVNFNAPVIQKDSQ